MPFIPGKQNSTGKMVEKDLYCSSEILTTTSTTGEVPTLQLHYPKGTKVVEIGNGRQFVSRPLDPRLMSETATRGNKLTDIENNEEQPYSQHSQRFNDRQRIHPLMYHADHPLYSEQNRSCAPPQTHSSVGSRYLNYDIQYGVSSSMETNTRHSAAPFHGNTGDSRHPFPQGFRQNYSTYGSYGITASPTKSIPTTSQQQQLGCTLGHPKNSGLAIGTPVNVQEILNSTNRSSMPPTVPTASRFLQQRRHVPNATQALSVSAPLQTFFQRSTNSSSLPPYTAPSQPPNTKSSTRLMKLLEGSTRMKTGLKDGVGRGSPVMVNAGYKADAMTLKTSSRGMSGGGGGIQWLFDAAATAHSPWAGSNSETSPLSTPRSPQQSQDAWDFSRPEDVVDDEFLFRREEFQRRRNPRYLAKTRRLHDLHIVMPICIPYGKIIVDDPLGANFYQFSDKPKNAGAEILFGKGISNSVPKMEQQQQQHQESFENIDQENGNLNIEKKIPKKESADAKPVCDVWASFLNVRLGTIYNLTPSQMPIVADLFKRSFDQDLCKFYVPISLDCRGVHPSSDEMISQRAARPSELMRETKSGRKTTSERYETHGVPTSENDIKRLRMVRRHLRRFAFRLIDDLGFDSVPSSIKDYEHPIQAAMRMANEQPRPCIELHDNCRTETIVNGALKIVVREWSPLSNPEVFKRVWAGHLSSDHSGVAAEVRTKLLEHKTVPSARVLSGELRLEYDHLRMVDPRWPEELVPGRRVADSCPENDAPGPEESQARFVFCSRVPKPQIIYAYTKADGNDPRDAALTCRLSALFKVHLARHPTAGVKSFSSLKDRAPASVTGTPEPPTGSSTPSQRRLSSDSVRLEGKQPAENFESQRGEQTTKNVDNKQKEFKAEVQHEATEQQHKPITSFCDLKTIPEPFVPVLPESRRYLTQYYDKGEMPQLLQFMLHQTSEAEKVISDQSALKSDTAIRVPLTTVACKYFLQGEGCARGSRCYFLHPADPKLESRVDVRHIVPQHPKFF